MKIEYIVDVMIDMRVKETCYDLSFDLLCLPCEPISYIVSYPVLVPINKKINILF